MLAYKDDAGAELGWHNGLMCGHAASQQDPSLGWKVGIMATKAITDTSFDADVLNSDKPVLVDFWAQWCGPCKAIGPILETISNDRDDVVIAKMDIDDNPETPTKFGIRSIPTMILFKNGEPVSTVMGAKPAAQLTQWIDSNI